MKNITIPAFCNLSALSMMMFAVLSGGGCAVRQGRDYGHLLFSPSDYFQIQSVASSAAVAKGPVLVDSLLLLPPVGQISSPFSEHFSQAIWHELQQILPGIVRSPVTQGGFAAYVVSANLIRDDGGLVIEEAVQIGRMAGCSHVLLPRVHVYRPYHPQRIIMEWVLIDVRTERLLLTLTGGIDASEQRVLISADKYLRQRKANPYNNSNLQFMLRSPRDYLSFAVCQAVEVMKGGVVSGMTLSRFKPDAANADKLTGRVSY